MNKALLKTTDKALVRSYKEYLGMDLKLDSDKFTVSIKGKRVKLTKVLRDALREEIIEVMQNQIFDINVESVVVN